MQKFSIKNWKPMNEWFSYWDDGSIETNAKGTMSRYWQITFLNESSSKKTAPFTWIGHDLHYKWHVYRNSRACIPHNIYPVPADGTLYVHVQSMSNYFYRTLYILHILVYSPKRTQYHPQIKKACTRPSKTPFRTFINWKMFLFTNNTYYSLFCTANKGIFQ